MHTVAGSGKRTADDDLLSGALAFRGFGELVDEAPADLQVELGNRIGRRHSIQPRRGEGRGDGGSRGESGCWVAARIRWYSRGLGCWDIAANSGYAHGTLETFSAHAAAYLAIKVPSYHGTYMQSSMIPRYRGTFLPRLWRKPAEAAQLVHEALDLD
jgi:hypothetical protein